MSAVQGTGKRCESITAMSGARHTSRGRALHRSPQRELPDPLAVVLREPLLLALGGRLGGLLGWLRLCFSHCYASLLHLYPRVPRKGLRSGASSPRVIPATFASPWTGHSPPPQ